MSLPTKNFRGQAVTITITELRSALGDVMDRVAHGMIVTVEKNGKSVAVLAPPTRPQSEEVVVWPDGSIDGPLPLTFRSNLVTFRSNLGNGGYGKLTPPSDPEPVPPTQAAAAVADAATWPGETASQGMLRTQQPPTPEEV